MGYEAVDSVYTVKSELISFCLISDFYEGRINPSHSLDLKLRCPGRLALGDFVADGSAAFQPASAFDYARRSPSRFRPL